MVVSYLCEMSLNVRMRLLMNATGCVNIAMARWMNAMMLRSRFSNLKDVVDTSPFAVSKYQRRRSITCPRYRWSHQFAECHLWDTRHAVADAVSQPGLVGAAANPGFRKTEMSAGSPCRQSRVEREAGSGKLRCGQARSGRCGEVRCVMWARCGHCGVALAFPTLRSTRRPKRPKPLFTVLTALPHSTHLLPQHTGLSFSQRTILTQYKT